MKKLTWKKVTTLLFLSVFLAACGSDSEQAVEVSKATPQKVEEKKVEKKKKRKKKESTSSIIEVSDFNIFKSKVSKGEFASIANFKKNMMMENATTIQVLLQNVILITMTLMKQRKMLVFGQKLEIF